jgi:hypothetical protein
LTDKFGGGGFRSNSVPTNPSKIEPDIAVLDPAELAKFPAKQVDVRLP